MQSSNDDYDDDPVFMAGRRSFSRLRLSIPARVDLICGPAKCSLENISARGARIAMPECPPVNALGLLHCNGIEACFTVIWRMGDRAGLLFDRLAPQEAVVSLRWLTDNTSKLEIEQLRREAMDWVGLAAGGRSAH